MNQIIKLLSAEWADESTARFSFEDAEYKIFESSKSNSVVLD